MGAFPNCDGIGIDYVFQGTFLWKYLESSALLKDQFLPYVPGEVRPFSVLPLPGTYGEFMARFNKKKRYNLKRQGRILRERFRGDLALLRVESAEDVPRFVRSLQALSRANGLPVAGDPSAYWAKMEEDLVHMARRRLLRSYCLASGEISLAYIRACRYRDTLRVQGTGFHPQFAHLSPGTTLLQLIVEDLIESGVIKEIQFGMGDPELSHYASYSYVATPCASFLVLRKTLAKRALLAGHSLLRSCKRWVKARAAENRSCRQGRQEAASASPAWPGAV
jgi:hypothetical protein